jgi:t-SNARE complex subunit (syntaxin)
MEDNNQEVVSNKRFYLSPSSITVTLFEKELEEKGISFHSDFLTIRQSYIVYSFFEKDLPVVIEIYDRLIAKLQKQEEVAYKRKKEIRKAKRKTPEYRQKRITVWILVLISIIVILSLLLS